MASEMKIKQLRYYNEPTVTYDNEGHQVVITQNAPAVNYNFYCNEVSFAQFAQIQQLGIQTLPGTKFYLNQSIDPIIIGGTGIFELDLRNTTAILSSLRFDKNSMINIAKNPNGFLIIDMVYSVGN